LWAHELITKAQRKVLAEKRLLNDEGVSFLRSQEHLQEAIERNHHWKANPHVIHDRVRDEFDAEEKERAIRRRERDKRWAQEDREAKAAEVELATFVARAEADKLRQNAPHSGGANKSETAEDIVRKQAKQILNHGSTGRFVPIAEEYRAELIDKRGGVEHLTDEDNERIELMFELAHHKQESKG
jgi:hypothetical protein